MLTCSNLSSSTCVYFPYIGISSDAAVTKNYTDMKRTRSSVDKTAQEKLTNFKNDLMMKLNTNNQYNFAIRWHENGLSPCDSAEHADYLENFQNSFGFNIKCHVEKYLSDALSSQTIKTPCDVTRHVYSEVWDSSHTKPTAIAARLAGVPRYRSTTEATSTVRKSRDGFNLRARGLWEERAGVEIMRCRLWFAIQRGGGSLRGHDTWLKDSLGCPPQYLLAAWLPG